MPRAEHRSTGAQRGRRGPRARQLLTGTLLIGALAAWPGSASSRDFAGSGDRGSQTNADWNHASADHGPAQSEAGGPLRADPRGGGLAVAADWAPAQAQATPATGPPAWSHAGGNDQASQSGDSSAPRANQPAAEVHAPATWASRPTASSTASSTPAASPSPSTPAAQAASVSVTPAPASSAPSAASTPAATTPAASHGLGGARHSRRASAPRPAGHSATLAAATTGARPGGRRGSTRTRTSRQAGSGPSATAARVAAAGHAPDAVRRVRGRGSSSPLGRTVTRIIQVIPAPLRPAVGILGVLALALAAAAGLLVMRSRRLERQRRRLVADVGLLESTLLPSLPEQLGCAYVSTAYRPAEDLGAGGDFFDAFALSDTRTCLIVGDIAGHTRQSILLTATVRYTLRAYVEAGLEPREALALASSVLGPRLAEQMATAVVAVYDGDTGRLTYACAGHPSPILVGAELHSPTIGSSPLLGAGVPTGRRQVTVTLPPGASACFYTDGLIDPRIDGGRFGAPRLSRELADLGAETTAQDVLLRVLACSDEQTDDMTACVLRPLPGGASEPCVHIEEIELNAAGLARGGARFLEACGVAADAVPGVLERAQAVAARVGTAVLVIHMGDGGGEAHVEEPPKAVVPLTVRPLDSGASALVASG